MDFKQINDLQVQVSIPLTPEYMTEGMRNLADQTVALMCNVADCSNKNHHNVKCLKYFGEFLKWSASLTITVKVDGSKTIFLNIDTYFEHDSRHKSFQLEDLPEGLIDRYSGLAFMAAVESFAGNFSRCTFYYMMP